MSDLHSTDPVTVTIPDALRLSGLGRTKLYDLLTKGEIQSVRVGSRRLIVFATLKALLTPKTTQLAAESR
jgi:excisionase family DNA binding protein